MNKSELIAALNDMPEDLPVVLYVENMVTPVGKKVPWILPGRLVSVKEMTNRNGDRLIGLTGAR
jgi:hypothetical protein